jgi:hypothetical protein
VCVGDWLDLLTGEQTNEPKKHSQMGITAHRSCGLCVTNVTLSGDTAVASDNSEALIIEKDRGEMERDAMKSASQCQTSRCFCIAHVQVEEPQPREMTDTESTFSGPICIISGCKKHSEVWRGQENMPGCKRNILTLLKKNIYWMIGRGFEPLQISLPQCCFVQSKYLNLSVAP